MKLRVGVVDLVANGPHLTLYQRMLNANFASIMPQAIAVWCERDGHDVRYLCYTGGERVVQEVGEDADVVFLSAYTESALLAYALSQRFRAAGAVTVLGGPHARCFPEDARRYFDYVVGLADRELIRDILAEAAPRRPLGLHLSRPVQPAALPGVRERWKHVEVTLRRSRWLRVVPMLASVGCPYTCSFCIDAVVAHRPFELAETQADLRFLLRTEPRPLVGWHDPNFGVRFDETLDAIEAAVPLGRIRFVAESSLSLLSDAHLARLRRNGFVGMLSGIESWNEFGNKASAGGLRGMDKVRAVAQRVNEVARHVPYVVTNFIFGTDLDQGEEPFELTRRFLRLAPAAHPSVSMLIAYGRGAPSNLGYLQANRVRAVPFHVLNSNRMSNIEPRHYTWPDLHARVSRLYRDLYSVRSTTQRVWRSRGLLPRVVHALRAASTEGRGMVAHHAQTCARLTQDASFRRFYDGLTDEVPRVYVERIRRDLGEFWRWLPTEALSHDPHDRGSHGSTDRALTTAQA